MAGGGRALRPPEPTARELEALARLASGAGAPGDVTAAKLLTDRCGRHGCAYLRTSRSSPGFAECPGWRDALEAHRRAERAREAALSNEAPAKPGRVPRNARRALRALAAGEPPTAADVLALELLRSDCRRDGCVSEGTGAALASGIAECPG